MPKKQKNSQEPSTASGADAGTAPAVIIPENIRTEETSLPLADICPVFNARTEFDQAYIEQELAPSIQKWGIQNRLWVFPLETPASNGARYGLIAGECRWRAAHFTNFFAAPVKIFHCSQTQAIELGLIDNIQRQNLTEVDEAFGYKKLIDECGYKAWDPADPEHSVGHKLGKSKTKVYSLLKLVELPKLGLDAVRAGQLSASVAVRIARIPNEKAQKEAVQEAIRNEWTDEYASDVIARRFMTELKGAPFDRKDATLVSERGSCDACPFRSGNQAEMFGDAKGRGDLCTDPACYRKKCEASFAIRAQEHKAKGGVVLSKKKAEEAGLQTGYSSVGGAFAHLDQTAYAIDEYHKTWRQVLKPLLDEQEIQPMLAIANDGSGKHYEIIRIDETKAELKKRGLYKESKNSGSSQEAQHRKQRELAKRRVMHQLDSLVDTVEIWAAERPVLAGAPIGDDAIRLLQGLTLFQVRHTGADALRLIAKRRQLELKNFKLETDHGTQQAAERALVQFVETAINIELIGLLIELIATPPYLADDGTLPQARLAPFEELLGIDLKKLHAAACATEKREQELAKERGKGKRAKKPEAAELAQI